MKTFDVAPCNNLTQDHTQLQAIACMHLKYTNFISHTIGFSSCNINSCGNTQEYARPKPCYYFTHFDTHRRTYTNVVN